MEQDPPAPPLTLGRFAHLSGLLTPDAVTRCRATAGGWNGSATCSPPGSATWTATWRKGITVSTPGTGVCPVQIKIAVDDLAKAVESYRAAFDLRYEVTRRAEDADYSSFVFGE